MRKHPRILATITAIGLSSISILSLQRPSLASSNWQERDGIAGEIKYARACNTGNSIRYTIISDVNSRFNKVFSVETKSFSAFNIGLNLFGQVFGFPSSPTWREVVSQRNLGGNPERRWYRHDNTIPFASYIQNTPIKFALHINRTGGKTIDLGGIVNLGDVPSGQCRTYDDGNYQNY